MNIYTTYFAQLRKLPETIVPISICARPPKGWLEAEYRALAPTYSILSEYKRNGDKTMYIERYNAVILSIPLVQRLTD